MGKRGALEKGSWRTVDWVGYGLAAAVLSASAAILFRSDLIVPGVEDPGAETWIAPPPQVPGPVVNKWKEAARKVEETRGEKTGRAARVRVPAQLLHYADKRRFLAIQVAGWREHNFEIPHDEAGLAALIRKGELVEVKPVTDDYVLYGVGANASDGPLEHFDARTGREVTLYSGWAAFDDMRAAKRAEVDAKKAEVESTRAEFRKTSAKTRAGRNRRSALNREVQAGRAQIAALERRIANDAAYWDNYDRRRVLVEEGHVLHEQARAFAPRGYDLERPGDRRAFRARLLSFIRPEALAVMVEIAKEYRAQFGRPLAFTSLVRSDHYQRQLGETNANATKIAVPPHTTGLAFDIFYRYMTADEQHAIMGAIGRMESEGRLEALRENRDHYHVFAFANGRRPSDRLIAEALGDVRPVRLAAGSSTPAVRARSTARSGRAARASLKSRAAPRPKVVRKPTARRRR